MRELAATMQVNDPAVALLSNKDGGVVSSGREVLDRIVNQIANPVRWDLCMQSLLAQGVTGVVELAPAGTLAGLIKRATPSIAQFALKSGADLESAGEFIAQHGGK
jgi:[acyl-carrier-protein] S-malonyltransferase